MSASKNALYTPGRNPLFRGDYRPLDYVTPRISLHIDMHKTASIVTNEMNVTLNPKNAAAGGPLILDGEDMALLSLEINDGSGWRALDVADYMVTDKNLVIKRPPAQPFKLRVKTEVNPTANTSLSGLYMAGDILTTQCEAQGFRRISYSLDRPDNMSVYDVTLEADKKEFPVLLSNGNGDYSQSTDLGNGRHAVSWADPWPKPSYLFAAVGGNLKVLEDSFVTMTGKKVDLRIFVQPGYEGKIDWAMESIKRSMKWDEDRYGREYDLDCFHIVAVDKFNAGAMENKGLNIFNVKYLVGTPDTCTDDELLYIERVIGHEYFHNYSGDRVTVRDWFELTLKEGFTVLRDRQFMEDMMSKDNKRIQDAILLRSTQFMEDAGPTSHPIRPDMVEEFNNIYTGTIYDKGSHVLGMMHTMMGESVWRLATDEYFSRFDSQAVTCGDFVNVMEEISGIDMTQFRLWYSQSGTPEITYQGVYDPAAKTYTLTLSQHNAPTADQSVKHNLHIPVAVGLIGQSGKDIPLVLEGDDQSPTTRVLHLKGSSQTYVFLNVSGPVVPSVLRGFSAPVKVTTEPTDDELLFRMAHDSDGYNRYAAYEMLMVKTLRGLITDIAADKPAVVPAKLIQAFGDNVAAALDADDKAFASLMLTLPSRNIIFQNLSVIDPDAVEDAYHLLKQVLADGHLSAFNQIYKQTTAASGEAYDVNPEQVGRRSLHNVALSYLAASTIPATREAVNQYYTSRNMTEKLAALSVLSNTEGAEAQATAALDHFYQTYKNDTNIVDKWLGLSAARPSADPVATVKALMQHPAYDPTNPNKVRVVIGSFVSGNPGAFHALDGSGYKLIADTVIALNEINGSTAAALSKHLTGFKRYDADRQALMISEMERIMSVPTLDTGVKEIVGKALATATNVPRNDNKAQNSFKKAAGQ